MDIHVLRPVHVLRPPENGGRALQLLPLSGTKSDLNTEKSQPKQANRQD